MLYFHWLFSLPLIIMLSFLHYFITISFINITDYCITLYYYFHYFHWLLFSSYYYYASHFHFTPLLELFLFPYYCLFIFRYYDLIIDADIYYDITIIYYYIIIATLLLIHYYISALFYYIYFIIILFSFYFWYYWFFSWLFSFIDEPPFLPLPFARDASYWYHAYWCCFIFIIFAIAYIVFYVIIYFYTHIYIYAIFSTDSSSTLCSILPLLYFHIIIYCILLALPCHLLRLLLLLISFLLYYDISFHIYYFLFSLFSFFIIATFMLWLPWWLYIISFSLLPFTYYYFSDYAFLLLSSMHLFLLFIYYIIYIVIYYAIVLLLYLFSIDDYITSLFIDIDYIYFHMYYCHIITTLFID